jgi:hypothetical protein
MLTRLFKTLSNGHKIINIHSRMAAFRRPFSAKYELSDVEDDPNVITNSFVITHMFTD